MKIIDENGEKYVRKNRVSQLVNEVIRDWKKLGFKLKKSCN